MAQSDLVIETLTQAGKVRIELTPTPPPKALLSDLIEFNKREPQVIGKYTVVQPKICGGFRLQIYSIGSLLTPSLDKDEFWSGLPKRIDGSEFVPAMKDEFYNQNARDVLIAIQKLWLKRGHIHKRTLVLSEPTEMPFDSTVFAWSKKDVAYAKSNLFFGAAPVGGNIYSISCKGNVSDILDVICDKETFSQPF